MYLYIENDEIVWGAEFVYSGSKPAPQGMIHIDDVIIRVLEVKDTNNQSVFESFLPYDFELRDLNSNQIKGFPKRGWFKNWLGKSGDQNDNHNYITYLVISTEGGEETILFKITAPIVDIGNE